MQAATPNRAAGDMVSAIEQLDLDPIKYKLIDPEEGPGWSRDYVERMELHYKRFLILLAKYPGRTIAPTKDIDKFWHGHILDTMKYMEDCERTFGYYLHHFPYFGMRGEDDAKNLLGAANEMSSLYAAEFGEPLPPSAAWCIKAESKTADAAWCIKADSKSADAAWCIKADSKSADAAWCIKADSKSADAAWCIKADSKSADAAWCIKADSKSADAAWCIKADSKSADAAWCIKADSKSADAAWCIKADSKSADAAWCIKAAGSPNQVPDVITRPRLAAAQ